MFAHWGLAHAPAIRERGSSESSAKRDWNSISNCLLAFFSSRVQGDLKSATRVRIVLNVEKSPKRQPSSHRRPSRSPKTTKVVFEKFTRKWPSP
jgi:hypothetical protein